MTADVLPDPCGAQVTQGSAIRVVSTRPVGRVRQVLELSTESAHPRVGLVTDSGLYVGAIEGDSVFPVVHLATLGRGDRQVLMIESISEGGDRSVVAFDRGMQRVVRWDSAGVFLNSVPVRHAAMVDDYVAGGGTVVAVTSRNGHRAYAPTTGELRTLDQLGYPADLLSTFPSLVVRLTASPTGSKYLRRPLERQPMVRWSSVHGWVIASTDSLNVHFGFAGNKRVIAGGGTRAPIDSVARDSSIDAFVRTTGVTGQARDQARGFATETFFRDRTELQLTDNVIPLLNGSFAIRRMRLCTGVSGWNVIDSLGRARNVFTVPLRYQPVTAMRDGVLFSVVDGNSMGLALLHLPVVAGNHNDRKMNQ